MHIISKFHDYYDTAMGQGFDKTLVYKRVNEPGSIIESVRWTYGVQEEKHQVGNMPQDSVTIKSWVVPLIFCGKFYKRAIAVVTHRNADPYSPQYYIEERFTGESRKVVLARVYAEFGLSEKTDEAKRKSPRWYQRPLRNEGISFTEMAENKDWIPTHIEEGCPVFLIRSTTQEERAKLPKRFFWIIDTEFYRIERNPCLKELGFFQVKNAYEAYQDISMFLGGVMGTDARPMVQLSDKEVHQKHGFDKWSFRKMPEHVNK